MLGPRHRQAGADEGAGQCARRLSVLLHSLTRVCSCEWMIRMQLLPKFMAYAAGVNLNCWKYMMHLSGHASLSNLLKHPQLHCQVFKTHA